MSDGATWIGLAVTFATLVFGIYQYHSTKREEFRQAFWQKQYETYKEVTEIAAAIAIADDLDAVKEERERFWQLYWGSMAIIENRNVFDAMVEFGEDLRDQTVRGHSSSGLLQLSYNLARACRESLKSTWEPVQIDDIPAQRSSSKDPFRKS